MSEYCAIEQACRACFGPCGRCHELLEEQRTKAAFMAGFQWAINGTDKYGEYNGGSTEDGFAEFLSQRNFPDGWSVRERQGGKVKVLDKHSEVPNNLVVSTPQT